MATNLTYLPFYLESVPGKKSENIGYGCDHGGLWFIGDAGEGAMPDASSNDYPIRTNVPISSDAITEVIFTADYNYNCSDQGICFYNLADEPQWSWNANNSRIAFSINCPEPFIYGKTLESGAGEILSDPAFYTFKVTYNPTHATEKVVAVIYMGEGTDSTPLTTITLDERLDAGNYGIGLDADNDGGDIDDQLPKSYFKYLSIKVDGVDIGHKNYTINFNTVNVPTEGGDGSLDTAIVNGHSIQRTGYLNIQRSDIESKVVEVADGSTVSNQPQGLSNINGIIAL